MKRVKYGYIFLCFVSFVLAISLFFPLEANGVFDNKTNPFNVISTGGPVTDTLGRAWNMIRAILRVVAVSVIIYCGVRYMFASADQKADIKKSLGVLMLGTAITFATTIIVDFVVDIAKDTL